MHLSTRHTFGADPVRVHALVTDPEFLAHACVEMGATHHQVSATPQASSIVVTVATMAAVRAFLGPTMTVRQEFRWGPALCDGSRAGSMRITVDGAPVLVATRAHLAPAPAGSLVDYEGELTVSVPLVGPQVERAAAPGVLEALAAQERLARAWLASR